jgi:ribosomal protein S18 acetylase RimI-like enzyme
MDSGLAEEVMEFDRRNMGPVFEKAGVEFPEENRLKGLESDPTFIIAFDGQAIAGYIEYLRSWNDPDYIYVGSIQIEKKYRGARLILVLLDGFRNRIAGEEFLGLETNVLKANTAAVRMYQKMGFRLEENPRNEASWLARSGREILTNSPVVKLIDEWRERRARRGAV